MIDLDQQDMESDALQADVMRFIAIMAFAILVVFIPIIQSVSTESQQKTESETVKVAALNKDSEISPKIDYEKSEAESEKTKPVEEKTDKKIKKLLFDDGAFRKLLAENKITTHIILTEVSLVFDVKYINEKYFYTKSVSPDLNAALKLRMSTIPKEMIDSFEITYPSFATQQKEYVFVPFGQIANEIENIKQTDAYGIFRILSNEKIIHE